MTATLTSRRITINLEAGCTYDTCADLAYRFKHQLGVPKYSHAASVLPMPFSVEAWRADHRTARKRADRARRLGYLFTDIDRSRFNDDIHEINTSMAERQGRPMSAGYLERHNHGPLPSYPCARHRVHTYGVLHGERLRAYLTVYRCGDLCLVSMILGHGDYLRDDIMYLLAGGLVEAQAGGGGFLFYNSHDSGTDGLRYYKERVGFRPTDITWTL